MMATRRMPPMARTRPTRPSPAPTAPARALRKIGVSLPTDLVRRLRMAAIATDRTMSAILTDLVAEWLAAQDAKTRR
jgi:hypothetical protein